MSPSNWSRSKLGDLVDLLTGYPFESASYDDMGEGIRLLRGDNVLPNQVRWDNAKRWKPEDADVMTQFALQRDDIVIAMDRTWISSGAKVAILTDADLPSLLVQRVARLRATPELDQLFLYQVLSSYGFEQHVLTGKTETAVPHISAQHIRGFDLFLPPLSEQRKIAEILRTWDDAIEKTSLLIRQGETKFAALVSELFIPSSDHRNLALSDVVSPIKTKNSVGDTNVLTSSGRYGLVSQFEYYNKSVASADISGYYLLENGDFAYNRSTSKGYPFGAIKRLDGYARGVLSTLYLCFRLTKGEELDSDYLAHLFDSGVLNKQLSAICQEGARSHGLLNIAQVDFFELVIPVPRVHRQRLIARVLNHAKAELEILEKARTALEAQKRGLMQKLLTGQIRVDVDEESDAHH